MIDRPLPVPLAFPASVRPYDIEADWVLMTTCNFRCTYCFFNNEALGRKIDPPADVRHLAAFFDQTGLTWMLHLTGGEPFHYPEFIELCRLLTQRHLISINTNADSPRIPHFVKTIDPDRVDFINCAVHFQQRLARNRLDQFVRHVHMLRTAGFDAFATSVMYPEVFPEFVARWDDLAEHGVFLAPKAFRGDYQGRRYPESYTAEERRVFIEYSLRAEDRYRDQMSLRAEPPTINPLLDRNRFLFGVRSYRGADCSAGHSMVTINPQGDINRCAGSGRIGNVADGWFERQPAASPCTVTFCPYYCEKYSSIGDDAMMARPGSPGVSA